LVGVIKVGEPFTSRSLRTNRAFRPSDPLRPLRSCGPRGTSRAAQTLEPLLSAQPPRTGGSHKGVRDPILVCVLRSARGVEIVAAYRELKPIIPAVNITVLVEREPLTSEPLRAAWSSLPLWTCRALGPLWTDQALRPLCPCWAAWALRARGACEA